MSYVLTAVDTSGIQSYVFGSNRLREHVGASEHVLRATTSWIWQTMEGLRVNRKDGDQPRDDSKQIERDDLEAEVIYAAGGNALILFKDMNQAQRWAQQLSKKALIEAPGLTLLIAHSEPFDWQPEGTDLAARVRDMFSNRLDQLKRTRPASASTLGLGVTATCQSTGLVATEIDKTDKTNWLRVSREVQAKTNMFDEANKRFNKLLHNYKKLDVDLPQQLDKLNPNKGERSYIAVVHADGNGIGKMFQTVWQGKSNRNGIRAVRDLSDTLTKVASNAFLTALSGLITSNIGLIDPYGNTFPVRPLIYGGDDLTFVCDGRIGVGLAARYLREFEQQSKTLPGEQFTAAAGVAIVKTHYPFARAYQLSEELCMSAKRLSREVSTLDWHMATSGTLAGIGEIREREYTVDAGHLAMRPVYLHSSPKPSEQWRTWRNVEEVMGVFQDARKDWAGKRNKIKQLREVLRNGGEAVEQFRNIYQTGDLPSYVGNATLPAKGWIDDYCGYFDPIELLDLYVPPFSVTGKEEARWLPTS